MVPATLIFIRTIYAERRSLKMLFLTLRDYNSFILIENFIVILVKPEWVGEKFKIFNNQNKNGSKNENNKE